MRTQFLCKLECLNAGEMESETVRPFEHFQTVRRDSTPCTWYQNTLCTTHCVLHTVLVLFSMQYTLSTYHVLSSAMSKRRLRRVTVLLWITATCYTRSAANLLQELDVFVKTSMEPPMIFLDQATCAASQIGRLRRFLVGISSWRFLLKKVPFEDYSLLRPPAKCISGGNE